MANYQSGTASEGGDWAGVIGNSLASSPSPTSTSFYITNSDGTLTRATGTGFTYNAGNTAVTGGTITGLTRVSGGLAAEQITGFSLSATTFWAASGSQKMANVLSG